MWVHPNSDIDERRECLGQRVGREKVFQLTGEHRDAGTLNELTRRQGGLASLVATAGA